MERAGLVRGRARPGDRLAGLVDRPRPDQRELPPPSGEAARPTRWPAALTPAPYLRRGFTWTGPVASARLHVTALGLYEARLNGRPGRRRLPDARLDRLRPAHPVPDLRRDRAAARRASNVLGAISRTAGTAASSASTPSGPGRTTAGRPSCWPSCVIALADGTRQTIVTDGQWRADFGAIRHADLLMGEKHDLTREPNGWDAPGFDAGELARRALSRPGRHAAGRRPGAADPGDAGDRRQRDPARPDGGAHHRLRAEPDRLAADRGRRPGRRLRPHPARRGADARTATCTPTTCAPRGRPTSS